MPAVPFSALPDHSRLWVFAAARPLGQAERDQLLAPVDRFLATWAAHGAPLTAARELRYDRFLFVAVDEKAAGVSGCSIDALTRQLKTLETELGVTLLETAPVFYRGEAEIQRASRNEFRELARRGVVRDTTVVFDNTVTSVGDARQRWEVEARHSWHVKAFPLSDPSVTPVHRP